MDMHEPMGSRSNCPMRSCKFKKKTKKKHILVALFSTIYPSRRIICRQEGNSTACGYRYLKISSVVLLIVHVLICSLQNIISMHVKYSTTIISTYKVKTRRQRLRNMHSYMPPQQQLNLFFPPICFSFAGQTVTSDDHQVHIDKKVVLNSNYLLIFLQLHMSSK